MVTAEAPLPGHGSSEISGAREFGSPVQPIGRLVAGEHVLGGLWVPELQGSGGWPQAARRARVNSGVSRVGLGLAPEAARCGTGMSGLGGNSSTERDCVPQGGQASSRGTRKVPREK